MSQLPDLKIFKSRPENVIDFTLKACGALLMLVGLSACVTPHPQGTVSDLAVSEVRTQAPEIPQAVRWGGTITAVENRADGTSVLEIVSRPLGYGGRPVRNDQSDGRFIAEVADVLDPTIVKAGRDITVTGLVGEVRIGTIGESPYRFPVVEVDDYHYWTPASARTYVGAYPYDYRCRYGYRHYGYYPYSARCGYSSFHFYGGSPLYGHRGRHGPRGRLGLSLTIRP